MKKNNFKISFAVLILAVLQMGHLTSCQDDMAADSYYTFTGETMSDFLDNNPNFSLFNQIVERAGRKAFLSSRGMRTLFPAVNEGVQAFLDENGYRSVEDITPDYCDILVKTAIVENFSIYTAQLDSSVQYNNELDLPLVLRTSSDTVDANGVALTIINRKSAIINELKNDSVENGVVQPVTKLLVPNLSLGTALLDEFNESEGFQIFYEALKRTGVADELALYDDRDNDYQEWKNNYEDFRRLWSGHRWYTAKRPDHLYRGYTCMIVKDKTLYEKYPDRFSSSKTLDENLKALYDLAVEKYSDEQAANIFGLNKIIEESDDEALIGKTYKEAYWQFTEEAIRSPYNPLHMFMAYHVLDRKFDSTDKMINLWGADPQYASPTEWVSTLLEFSSMKLERLSDSRVDPEMKQFGYYINHAAASERYSTKRVRGSILSVPSVENFVLNVAFYYVDDVLAYDTDMRSVVMNTRIRTDVMTLFPELTNNNIRMSGNFKFREDYDDDESGTDGFNYYIPPSYLDNVSMSGNTTMFIMRPHPSYWNMGGDEINFLGNDYDVEFRLPAVPPGTYEVRMGYAGMADRGIAQIYFDGEPEGIPMDLRFTATDGRVGGIYGVELSEEELEENNRTMKNNGFYRGPASLCRIRTQTDGPDFTPANVEYFDKIAPIMRKVLCTTYFSANEHHKLRVKSVWSGAEKGCFMIDYIELVPIAICGTGGLGEDIY